MNPTGLPIAATLATSGFIPHGYCFIWQPDILWLTVGSDFMIFLAYVAISLGLLYFVRQRQDLGFKSVFWLFGIFILACGFTHLLDVWTVWRPDFWVAAWIKFATAVASVGTAAMLWPLIPKALAIPSPLRLQLAYAEMAELSSHLQTAREDEKAVLARELHDELGATLTALSMDLYRLHQRLAAERNPMAPDLEASLAMLKGAVDIKRRVIEDLRPTILDQLGLAAAIDRLAAGFTERTGTPVDRSVPSALVLEKGLAIDLYRIVQEALTNVARHAGASRVSIRVEARGDGIELTIQDDGRGLRMEDTQKLMSHGLRGIRQRMVRWGGAVKVGSSQDQGTRLEVRVPVPARGAPPSAP